MTRWSEEDYRRAALRMRAQIESPLNIQGEEVVIDKRRTKYRNERSEWQGQIFDSQHELKVFREFELEKAAGKIRAVIRQVSFCLPGCKRRMRVDFAIVENDGRIRWVDAKGFATKEWELKRAQVQQAYGLTIETV